jgi:membrane-associated phospholipid phosphatase
VSARVQRPGALPAVFAADIGVVLIAVVLVIDALWVGVSGWAVRADGIALFALAEAALILPLAFRRYREDDRLREMLISAIILLAFGPASAALSYLAVSTSFTPIDAWLAAADRWLGFDWMSVFNWVDVHHWIKAVFFFAYQSGLPQIAFVVIFLGLTRRFETLRRFRLALMISMLLTIAVSAFWPAAGPWVHYGVQDRVPIDELSHWSALRSGQMRRLDLTAIQGLVAMPSYHTSTAVILMWSVYSSGLAGIVLIALNCIMIASTITTGGHYFVDVISGAMTAVLAIVGSRVVFVVRRTAE